jgi:hypothetical protein
MRILFDQGTPAPLRTFLTAHTVETAFERGWSELSNGDLISEAERERFELLVTTDKNLQFQQNLTQRRIAILVLWTTRWPDLRERIVEIVRAVESIQPAEYRELI